jgi:hypothetical protein
VNILPSEPVEQPAEEAMTGAPAPTAPAGDAPVGPSTGGTDEPNDQPYGDVFFENYGVNPRIDTEDDHLSTFAVDVDTASYTAAVNRVILCSDGVANVGNTGHGSIWQQIEEYAEEGIYLTSIGVGMGNYNDTLLEQLADNGDGFYAYVDDIRELGISSIR